MESTEEKLRHLTSFGEWSGFAERDRASADRSKRKPEHRCPAGAQVRMLNGAAVRVRVVCSRLSTHENMPGLDTPVRRTTSFRDA
jgi:hypothetical protein